MHRMYLLPEETLLALVFRFGIKQLFDEVCDPNTDGITYLTRAIFCDVKLQKTEFLVNEIKNDRICSFKGKMLLYW